MKIKNKRFLPLVAAVGISVGCSANSGPNQASAEDATYEIYPRPQAVQYGQQSFSIGSSVNVVFERGVDVYTQNRLKRILERSGIEFSVSGKPVAEKTNILVGINGSGGLVDRYFNKSVTHQEAFFEKTDAHIISVYDQIIAVLGADTDSAFYGVTTLKHVFNQLQDKRIRAFRIDDFSNVKHRGFIEGYYGNPWSNEDRAELMKFGGDYKLNTYFFAPKDDIYHNAKWRELYPEEELAEIRKLARVGNATKNKYVYALHTFMHSPVRFDNDSVYKNDLDIIKAKFKQLLENDVRAFSILADDAGVPSQGPSAYVKLLEDLTEWLVEQKKTYPDLVTDIPFCPNDYMGNGSSAQLREVNKAPDSTSIIMTGGRIWGEVSEDFTSNFIKNVASGGHPGRPAYLWINWPCSDNSKQHLIMGGNDTFLHPGVSPENIQGIILNPMQQAEANKSALFAIADYGWNIWDTKEQADHNRHDSFKYMDHGTAEETEASTALRTIAQHMINQNMDGRVRALQESVELAPKLDDLKGKLKTGTLKKGDTAALLQEFAALKAAAAYYKQNPGNERTRDQIIYWLNCWEDTTTAAINYLNCLDAVIDGDNEAIWSSYSTAQAAFEKSKSYKFRYVNHYEHAEVGVQHIVPFIKTMGQHLNEIVAGIIDPGRVVETYISNREDMPTGNLNTILDGDTNSGVVYKSPASIGAGEYVGLRYSNPKQIASVEFLLGTPANPADTFAEARIETTEDGTVWTPLSRETYTLPQEVKVEGLDLAVKGIRMIATKAKGNSWLGVREIVVNGGKDGEVADNGYTNTKIDLSVEATLDRATLEPMKRVTLMPGEYVGIKLDRIRDLKAITGKINTRKLTLQVSANGVEWETITSKQLPAARYIRVLNQTNQKVVFDIDRFEVESNEIFPIRYVAGHANVYKGTEAMQAFDGDFNTTVIFEKGFNAGDSIVYDLGQTLHVDNLKYVVLDTDTDHVRDAKFQLSLDGETWKDAFETARKSDDRDAKPQDNGYTHGSLSKGVIPISHAYVEGENLNTKARFFRIIATRAYQPRWVRISEVLINNGRYIPSSNDPTFISEPVELKGHGPENMVDGDLTTSYRPDTKGGRITSGSVTYRLSENTAVDQINIVQDGNSISNAKVMVRTGKNQWQALGVLNKSLNELSTKKVEHIFEIKIAWEGTAPTIYQIATIPSA